MVDTARPRFSESLFRDEPSSIAPDLESFAARALERVKQYARDEPVSFALWSFGIGFLLGWRLKPW